MERFKYPLRASDSDDFVANADRFFCRNQSFNLKRAVEWDEVVSTI